VVAFNFLWHKRKNITEHDPGKTGEFVRGRRLRIGALYTHGETIMLSAPIEEDVVNLAALHPNGVELQSEVTVVRAAIDTLNHRLRPSKQILNDFDQLQAHRVPDRMKQAPLVRVHAAQHDKLTRICLVIVPDLLTVAMVLVRDADVVDPLLMAKLPKFARPLELTPTSVEVGDIVLDPKVKQLTQVR
jgi:hypothetical protein